LKVSDDRRFLVTAEGRPFFWLGEAAFRFESFAGARETCAGAGFSLQ